MKNERKRLILFLVEFGSCFRTLAVILFQIFEIHTPYFSLALASVNTHSIKN